MPDKPRILALMGGAVMFGQERGNIEALAALKDKGCEVLCLVRDDAWATAIPNALDERGIPWRRSPYISHRMPGYLHHFLFKNPIQFVRANRLMFSVLSEFRPTQVHAPNPIYVANFYLVLMLRPKVLLIYRAGDKPTVHNIFWRCIWWAVSARVTHFVAISKFISSSLQDVGVKAEKISVIHNVPPVRRHRPHPEIPPEDPAHILFIGQITVEKGVDLLIDAFRQVCLDHRSAKLTIVGRIAEDWQGAAWARELRAAAMADLELSSRVDFVGESEEIYYYLAAAAVLAVPSTREEPSSNVVVEAKAAGRPSVVFPQGGLPELIEHGKDGFVCRDTTARALAEGLRYYLECPDRTREQGREAHRSLQRLGMDQFGNRWLDVYQRTLKRATSGGASSLRQETRLTP